MSENNNPSEAEKYLVRRAWDFLKYLGLSEQSIHLAIAMNGFSMKTMELVLNKSFELTSVPWADRELTSFKQCEGLWRDQKTGDGNVRMILVDRNWDDRIGPKGKPWVNAYFDLAATLSAEKLAAKE